MTYVEMIEDSEGSIVEIFYYDSAWCFESATGESARGHAWPGGMETGYDVFCAHCGKKMWEGID